MGNVHRRDSRRMSADPVVLAARLPVGLRSLDGFPIPTDYVAAVRDWLGPVAEVVSPSDVAEAAGVPAVREAFRHWLAH